MALSPHSPHSPKAASSNRKLRSGNSNNHLGDIMKMPSMGHTPSMLKMGAKKSQRATGRSNLLNEDDGATTSNEDLYDRAIADARRCIGKHGSQTGAFAEEWSAQLLVDCGKMQNNKGRRLMVFTPAVLTPILGDETELDRAFKFVLLAMHKTAMHEKYDFVFCFSGSTVLSPELMHRFQIAYDILPRPYAKHLGRLHIVHPTAGLKVSLMTAWFWITPRLWQKIEYHDTLEDLCDALHLGKDVRRRFPQIVHHADALALNMEPQLTFGSPLEWLCDEFGVDFVDRTTGRRYPLLPPAFICVCEALERHDSDQHLSLLFTGSATATYDVVGRLDEGLPLEPDTPLEVLWCALKLLLDCMPAPLLSFRAFEELQERGVKVNDKEAQRSLLLDVLHKSLPIDVSYVTLYLASFFHTMVQCSEERSASQASKESASLSDEIRPMRTNRAAPPRLTSQLLAAAFASCFLRPVEPSVESMRLVPNAVAVVEYLINSAEDPSFWIGKAPSSTDSYWDFKDEEDHMSGSSNSDSDAAH